jgi:zinc protease
MKKILIIALGILFVQNSFSQTVDRTKKPAAGPAPIITIKEPVTYILPNGITVLIVENHRFPKVRASYTIDAGPITEGAKAGVMDVMGGMLNEGTTNMTKEKFDESIDMIGADVNLNSSGGSVSALTRYFEKAFMLMADGLQNPSLPQAAFEKLKSQSITGFKSNEKSARVISSRVANALSFGKTSPMGEFTTEESLKGLTLDDVKNAYKNYITPSRGYLTFVGDITPAAAKALVEKAFGKWTGKKLALPLLPTVENNAKTEINFVDLPTAVQGEMTVTNLINNPMNGTDYHALLLANQILGGGAESKLFMNLREKHGFTYGAYSSVGRGRFQTMFTAGAAVRTDKVDSAVAELMAEIINMRDGKISAEEFAMAKAKINGTFALSMEDPARAATLASNVLINNLPKDFYKVYLQKINAVTIDDIKRVAKNYFSESRSRIVIVGNGKKIVPNLMRLGYAIKKFDKFASPVVDEVKEVVTTETAKTTDAVSGYSIIEDYLKAIGGKEEVKKVTSITSTLAMEMMGRQITGVEKKAAPNKVSQEFKMGTMTVMKAVYDGIKGYQQQGPQKKEMTEAELKEAVDEKGVIPQLFYNTADYKTEYLGKGKVNDQETYRLKVVMPSGRSSVQQFSMKTGLLLQEETTTKQEDTDVPITIEYLDYKKVGNLLLPHNIIRNAGGQEFNFKITAITLNDKLTDADFK